MLIQSFITPVVLFDLLKLKNQCFKSPLLSPRGVCGVVLCDVGPFYALHFTMQFGQIRIVPYNFAVIYAVRFGSV